MIKRLHPVFKIAFAPSIERFSRPACAGCRGRQPLRRDSRITVGTSIARPPSAAVLSTFAGRHDGRPYDGRGSRCGDIGAPHPPLARSPFPRGGRLGAGRVRRGAAFGLGTRCAGRRGRRPLRWVRKEFAQEWQCHRCVLRGPPRASAPTTGCGCKCICLHTKYKPSSNLNTAQPQPRSRLRNTLTLKNKSILTARKKAARGC